jgi:GMP synthase (glutamine-hydrolysing) A subunit
MDKIIILDFGSQVTQLIGRRLRELNVFCEIYPYNKVPALDDSVKGIILSGSPCSVRDANAPKAEITTGKIPVLGICYGAQYLAHTRGGKVEASNTREYGRAILRKVADSPLLKDISPKTQVWMSHGDTISKLPEGAEVIASTADVENAAYQFKDEPTYAVQFHPEVYHTTEGAKILANFALTICGCKGDWTPDSFIETTVAELKAIIGQDKVILGLSGGVDSTVAAMLLKVPVVKAIIICLVSNLVPMPFWIIVMKKLFKLMRERPGEHKITEWFARLAEKKQKGKKLSRTEFWGLVAFVGVPIPGTGGWTGGLIAAALDMDVKKGVLAIFLGMCIAMTIMCVVSYGVVGNVVS